MSKQQVVDGIPGLVSFWTFQEPEGSPRIAAGRAKLALKELGGTVARADEGVFGSYSAAFTGDELSRPCFYVPRAEAQPLNFHGPGAQVSIVAWVKRRFVPALEGHCQAVAGMWNEHGKRQYCLFLNLRIHESAEQVCAHVSHVGGPTPGFKYCMDAAIGATPVPFDRWQCVAITYDGEYARAFFNGRLDSRGGRNPYHYPHGLFDGGPNGADFTVGAVSRPEHVEMIAGRPVEYGSVQANCFRGLLGGLAVFDRALDAAEILRLSEETQP